MVVSVLRKSAQDRMGVPESAAAAYIVDTLLCVAGSGGDFRKEQERKREAQGAPQPAALAAGNAEMQVSSACSVFAVSLLSNHCKVSSACFFLLLCYFS